MLNIEYTLIQHYDVESEYILIQYYDVESMFIQC